MGGSGKWYSSDGQECEYNETDVITINFKDESKYTLKFVNNYDDGYNGLENVTDNSVKIVLMIGGSNGETNGIKPVNKNENAKLIFYNNITSIESYAFANCKGFTGDLIIPDSVISIWTSAFERCSGFTWDLIIPESATSIGTGAFRNCKGISRIYVCEDTELGNGWNNNTPAEVIKYKKGETPWLTEKK